MVVVGEMVERDEEEGRPEVPEKCVMSAGRDEVDSGILSKSRRTDSLPSQRRVAGFQVMSPTTGHQRYIQHERKDGAIHTFPLIDASQMLDQQCRLSRPFLVQASSSSSTTPVLALSSPTRFLPPLCLSQARQSSDIVA